MLEPIACALEQLLKFWDLIPYVVRLEKDRSRLHHRVASAIRLNVGCLQQLTGDLNGDCVANCADLDLIGETIKVSLTRELDIQVSTFAQITHPS